MKHGSTKRADIMQGKYYLRLRSLKGELAGDLDKKENQHQTYRIAKLMAKEKKTTCSICLKDSSRKLIIGEQKICGN